MVVPCEKPVVIAWWLGTVESFGRMGIIATDAKFKPWWSAKLKASSLLGRKDQKKNKLDVARNQILADEAFQGQEWVFQGHTVFQEHIQ